MHNFIIQIYTEENKSKIYKVPAKSRIEAVKSLYLARVEEIPHFNRYRLIGVEPV